MLPKITIPPHLLHLMICNAKHWRRPNELLKRTTCIYSKKTSQTTSLWGNLCCLGENTKIFSNTGKICLLPNAFLS